MPSSRARDVHSPQGTHAHSSATQVPTASNQLVLLRNPKVRLHAQDLMLMDPDLFCASIHAKLEFFYVLRGCARGIRACPRRQVVGRLRVKVKQYTLVFLVNCGAGARTRGGRVFVDSECAVDLYRLCGFGQPGTLAFFGGWLRWPLVGEEQGVN